jgi:very-short-patch-repair endonuclease
VSQFVKSLLNYYAAFTETRFSNRSILNYKWLDDPNLTLDISFFPDFFQLWVTKLDNHDHEPVNVHISQFKREIPAHRFRQKLDELLATSFNLESLQQFLAENREGKELTTPDELREAFLEGVRVYNLALRKALEQIVYTLQKEEIAAIETQHRTTQLPAPTFNVPKFSQDIYDTLQRAAVESEDEGTYFQNLKDILENRDYRLVLYDLYILLMQFAVVETYGTSYLFFGSIHQENGNNGNSAYPFFFIEVNFDTGMTDCVRLTIPRDLVLLNIPAINTFEFQNVLTIPRAASFAGSISHLRQMDGFLSSEYSLSPQPITTNEACSIPPPAEGLPHLKYRLGFQVIKNEDKRILDYSELMTKVERGEGSTITDFVDGYLTRNVVNTNDETNAKFRDDYPKNSAGYFYSDNPLPLNPSQKKILTAMGNPKNRVVVVDGPPGTGKSHTIAAVSYWANQNDKSIIITSHKKEALDVVERMLTDKFRKLHPHSKPSVIRISRDQELATLNTIENSLSLPVIDAAARRAEDFNVDPVGRDKVKVQQHLAQTISTAITQTKLLPKVSQKLLRLFELEEELAIDSGEIAGLPSLEMPEALRRFQELPGHIPLTDFRGITLESLTALYQRRHDIPRILDACNGLTSQGVDQDSLSGIDLTSLINLDTCKPLVDRLTVAFNHDLPLRRLAVTELASLPHPWRELQDIISSYRELQDVQQRLQELVNQTSFLGKIGLDKKFAAIKEKFVRDFPAVWVCAQQAGLKPDKLLAQVDSLLDMLHHLRGDTPYAMEFIYSLSRQPEDFTALEADLGDLNSLKFHHLLNAVALLHKKDKQDLNLKELAQGLKQLQAITRYSQDLQAITEFQEAVGLTERSHQDLYLLLDRLRRTLENLQPQTIDALKAVRDLYGHTLRRVGIDFSDLASLGKLTGLTQDEAKIMEFITLHGELIGEEAFLPEIRGQLEELNGYNQRLTEHTNDLRLKGFQNFQADMMRIKRSIAAGKRLTPEQAKLLCSTYACIVAEPEAIFRFFPMEEGLFDILIFDEASQVSIAHSLSLILRAKQVLVFGDKYQYGAVSAVNVSRKYSGAYFKKIIDEYRGEYHRTISVEQERRLLEEETTEVADEDLFVADIPRVDHLDAEQEWLKTFSIRISTLDFCQAIYNYYGSLTEHFRSFPEIIDYSNEVFYRPAQIPLVVNRLRTKPIDAVLRFLKVETQGHSGRNVNLDEIEAIRQDIEKLTADSYQGTIGIITSFREQRDRAEKYLREKLPNYHRLKEENRLTMWFVGDVQGEERDIVYYSLVQDKRIGNADLRTIYPTPGGTADTIKSLKMQRLNVGFSRAKDTMVFVHSMDLGEYADSRLGDALQHYRTILEETRPKDHFIADDSVFESPKEKELYTHITQTDFYRQHRDRLLIIPQFNIGRYIQQEFQKYIPRYRVDFLLTLADGGKEKSLILEYDGLEYHTKDPEVVRSLEDFKEEYLEYDLARQMELVSYGYHFLRINKFTLRPRKAGETRVEVLNELLARAFAL